MPKDQPYKVLVIDDEPDLRELLAYNLSKEGYQVKTAADGHQGLVMAKSFLPHVILLDIMMPGIDGVETGRRLREIADLDHSLLIFLTARNEEFSEIAAFDIGADDYIVKPIKPRALLSRLSASIRRKFHQETPQEELSFEGLLINRIRYSVQIGEDPTPVSLPKKEFELLLFLAQHPNQVFSRDELLSKVWGSGVYIIARTVDVHIRKVREKIGDTYIKTIKGVGYKFETAQP